ncbi:uncharacterized protein METZ01_LOCUS183359 [marine metagenome]|uniref:Uncharacterized protein n=1 Tax=marine metagenome TaxID=408172 RepID=A0A382CWR8_9ZZZZ
MKKTNLAILSPYYSTAHLAVNFDITTLTYMVFSVIVRKSFSRIVILVKVFRRIFLLFVD